MVPPLDTCAAPAVDSGLVAERTSGSLRSVETVASIPSAYLASVIFVPFGALSVTGAVPLAWSGSWSSRRSVAFWLSVPGSFRLSLRSEPRLRAPRARPTKTTSQTASTIHLWRTPTPPRGRGRSTCGGRTHGRGGTALQSQRTPSGDPGAENMAAVRRDALAVRPT